MTKLTRRDFLKIGAAGIGGLAAGQFLTACGQENPLNIVPSATSSSPTETLTPEINTVPPPTGTPNIIPDLVIARGGEPEDLVRRALAALGGMEKFVPTGANVVVKPNICVAYYGYEYAATTNPWVVYTLVKMCFEAGAGSVKVMDAPFGGTAQEAYLKSGIQEQVEAAGGEMVYMPAFKYVPAEIPSGVKLKKVDIFDEILKTDVLINVPIAKHHSTTRLTLGMKNLMGVILDRNALHIGDIGQHIADLTSLVKPTLTVVDAIRILTANGPAGGSLDYVSQLDTIIASRDIVAADSYATTLFRMQPGDIQMKPSDIGFIVAGAAMGLGRSDWQNLKYQEI